MKGRFKTKKIPTFGGV